MLTPAQKIALAKVLTKEAEAEEVETGTHGVSGTYVVTMDGSLSKGADYMSKPTTSFPTKAIIGFMLKRMGFQRDGALEFMTGVMDEVFAAGLFEKEAEKALLLEKPEIAAMVGMLDTYIAKLPKRPAKGRTTVDATVTVEEVAEPIRKSA